MNASASLRRAAPDLALGALFVAGLALSLGSPAAWFDAPRADDWRRMLHWQVYWPRALMAAMIGSGLGAAGWICQRLAHNPLASPALLGVPAGAAAGVLLLVAAAGDVVLHSLAVPGAAMAGGLVAGVLLLLVAEVRFEWQGTELLLVGVAIGALLGAATFALALHTEPIVYRFAMAWLAGSLATSSWSDVAVLHPPWAALLAAALLCTRTLLVLGFDDDTAGSLGVSPRRWRRRAFVLAVVLTALCVSGGGAFAFVGFAAPHLARRLGGAAADRPGPAGLVGAAMLLLADGAVRRDLVGTGLPAGVAVAALCLPWLVVELVRSGRRDA